MILLYHRVGPDEHPWLLPSLPAETFAWQMAHLSRYYHVIPLAHAIEYFKTGAELPPRSVVLTFDDGWADIYHNAFPVLRRLRLPATVFLCTEMVERRRLFPSDRLRYAAYHATVGGLTGEALYMEVWRRVRQAPTWSEAQIDGICAELGVPEDAREADEHVLAWAQVEEMAAGGISFGAHTRTHPDLRRLTPEERVRELAGSLADVIRHVPSTFRPMAYPFGRYNDEIAQTCADVGFSCALSTERGARPYRSVFEIGRVYADPPWFRLHIAGFTRTAPLRVTSALWKAGLGA